MASASSALCPINIPPPHGSLSITRVIWPVNQVLHRVHDQAYAADGFNPGVNGNARFSPILDRGFTPARQIPTLYGGTTFDCAAMETVFHDVPFAPGMKTYDKRKLTGQVHSMLMPTAHLVLADLQTIALRKLGVSRNQLIDTEKACYPDTRAWAAAIYAQAPDVQGLCWTPRQDDSAQAVVLFGSRVGPGVLQPQGPPRSLVGDPDAYRDLLQLAHAIGADITSHLPLP